MQPREHTRVQLKHATHIGLSPFRVPCLQIQLCCMFSCCRLTELSVADNQLTGNLSLSSVYNWTMLPLLKHVNMSRNGLSGSLPPEWSNLRNNVTIDVSHNNLTGPLPAAWSLVGADGLIMPLAYLDASYNSLTGMTLLQSKDCLSTAMKW